MVVGTVWFPVQFLPKDGPNLPKDTPNCSVVPRTLLSRLSSNNFPTLSTYPSGVALDPEGWMMDRTGCLETPDQAPKCQSSRSISLMFRIDFQAECSLNATRTFQFSKIKYRPICFFFGKCRAKLMTLDPLGQRWGHCRRKYLYKNTIVMKTK